MSALRHKCDTASDAAAKHWQQRSFGVNGKLSMIIIRLSMIIEVFKATHIAAY